MRREPSFDSLHVIPTPRYCPLMTEPPSTENTTPSTRLSPEEMERRSWSFGGSALLYERFRPGPPAEAVDWMLRIRPTSVVELGAGTGAMTKLLVERANDVIAVEPDDRMLEVLTRNLPSVTALSGTGEAIPLPDSSADAVLASSSWHWMDPVKALGEAERVLKSGGILGAVWTGPDPEGPFLLQARELLGQRSRGDGDDLGIDSSVIDPNLPSQVLSIPGDSPFTQPEQQILTWDVALNADELIGLLGTFSWIILMSEDQRSGVISTVRRLLRDALGVEGDVTVDVQYRSEAWRTRLNG